MSNPATPRFSRRLTRGLTQRRTLPWLTALFCIVFVVLVVSSCNGPSDAANSAPIAVAGADRSVPVGEALVLDGSASSDPDGDDLSFAWRLEQRPGGSAAELSGAGTPTASLTPDVIGSYVASLTVSDGQLEATDEVAIAVGAPVNQAPLAAAGPNRSVALGAPVTLDGSQSVDPEGDALDFSWSFASKPATSTATLQDADTATPTFIPDAAGDYRVLLDVSDGSASSQDEVQISTTNTMPTADAGDDLQGEVGMLVTLSGQGSTDPDGDTLDYAWRFVTNPSTSATLVDAQTATPSFVADTAGSYTLELTVSDGELSASDRVTVTASSATATGTIYVSPTGDDGNRGDAANPLRTVRAAVELANGSSEVARITLLDGTYAYDTSSEPFDYVVERTYQIEGESRAGVVLAAGGRRIFSLQSGADLFLLGLTLDGGSPAIQVPDGASLNMSGVTCQQSDICVQATAETGWIPVGGDITVTDSSLIGAGSGTGIYAVGGKTDVTDTTIRSFDRGVHSVLALDNSSLTNVTATDNSYGLYLEASYQTDAGEESELAVFGGEYSDNTYGIYIDNARVGVAHVVVSRSAEAGVHVTGVKRAELQEVTIQDSRASGLFADDGAFVAITGGIFRRNGNSTREDFVNRAGLYFAGQAYADVQNASVTNNVQDNIVFLEDAQGVLTDMTVAAAGQAGVYANTNGSVELVRGSFNGNRNGLYVRGATGLVLTETTAENNSLSGVDFGGRSLSMRGSYLYTNGRYNLRVTGSPAVVDLGSVASPAYNRFKNGADTDWGISDERPARAKPDGVVIEAYSSVFSGPSTQPRISREDRIYVGPVSDADRYWRIANANQRARF